MKETDTKKTLIISILINVCVLLLLLLVFFPVFETNDDNGMNSLVAGTRGMRDPHIIYSNYFLGQLLVFLFRLAPGIPWYSILQYSFIFISFTAICFVFFQLFRSRYIRALIVALITFFSYEAYIEIQFTKTAGVMVAAGITLIFYGLMRDSVSKAPVIMGVILSVLGSFYRTPQAYCEIAVFVPLAVYSIMGCLGEKDGKKRIIKTAVIGIALLALIAGFKNLDRMQYTDDGWSEYLEYNRYRAKVKDYGLPPYRKNKEKYNELGIDGSAYKMMRHWVFQDNERFTIDVFKEIAGLREKKKIDSELVKEYLISVVKGLYREGSFLCFLCVALCWLFLKKGGKKGWICAILLGILTAFVYFYFFYSGRFMIHRVDVGIWLSASIVMLFMSEDKDKKLAPLLAVLGILMVSVTALKWQDNIRTDYSKVRTEAENEKKIIRELNEDQDHLYLTKRKTIFFDVAFGVFDPMPYKCADNIYPLSGWAAETPPYKSVLKRYGVDNPLKDLVDREDVFLVDNDIDTTLRYIRKWYSKDAKAVLVKSIKDNGVYLIKSS